MTNKEAIEFLKNMINREAIGFVCPEREGDVAIWQYHIEALQMAISALQEQDSPKPKAESVQNVQKEDLISRKAAIDAIEKNAYRHTYLDQIIDIVSELPSAQPEIEERKEESAQNVPKEDLISRKAAIDSLDCINGVEEVLRALPSAQPEPLVVDSVQ